jgi:hypothetical protein
MRHSISSSREEEKRPAEHLLDWTIPDLPGSPQAKARKARRSTEPILQIISHIASGAKHFRATAAHHDSVTHTDVHQGGFDARSFDPSAFSVNGLHVELEDGTLLHAYTLADQVIEYWRRQLGL